MKVKYSTFELKILEQLPSDGMKLSTTEITGKVYPAGQTPRFGRQSVLVALNHIIDKSNENQEPWEICKSKHRGAQPTYFWRIPREDFAKTG